jgi:hypothetical protein
MALSLTHSTVVAVPDDGTSPVGSDEWNAQHNFTLSGDVLVGRLSTSGTAQELNGTQITALLDPVSSTLKGLAPASGGGTTNFLRADGTWAAPPITTIGTTAIGGGTSGNFLYDNAGIYGERTPTQTTAQLDLFSTTLKGLTPASGGGTINFLRADATWAAIPASALTVNTTTIAGGTSGNSLYDNAGTVGERTPTQLTAVLDLFSNSLKGLTPSSGGGTTNFLRADGTWAAPPGGAGGTPGGASLTVQYNNAGAFGGMSGTSWDDANRSLTMTGATVTTNHPILDLTQTWNAGAVTFSGLRLNVTSTASSAASLLLDLQVGGGGIFNVAKDGTIGMFNSAGGTHNFQFVVDTTGSLLIRDQSAGATTYLAASAGNKVSLPSASLFGWANAVIVAGSAPVQDVVLARDAAGILAQRNLANAQGQRLYNTTDSGIANYERGVFDWTTTANTLTIGTQALGTGTLRGVNAIGAWTYVGGTVTTNNPPLSLSQTWNATGVAFQTLAVNVTNTSSTVGAGKILDLQVGGATKFAFTPGWGFAATTQTFWLGDPTSAGNAAVPIIVNDTTRLMISRGDLNAHQGILMDTVANPGITFMSNYFLSWSNSTTAWNSAVDVSLSRESAGILSQHGQGATSTTPQGQRVYNITDAGLANYERGVFDWTTTANTLTIGTQAAGTGTARNINFVAGATTFMDFGVSIAGSLSLQGQTLVGGVGLGSAAFIVIPPSNIIRMQSNAQFGWSSGSLNLAADVGISRTATKVARFGDGGLNANGWMQWAGQARVTADVTYTSTTTPALVTGLAVALQAGRTYSFLVELSFTDAAAGGIQCAMAAAGGLTATNIIYDGYIIDSAANGIKGNAQATSLGGVVANAATTGTAGHVVIKGTITVGVAGTLQVNAAQSVSNATATTVKQGSYMIINDMP